MTINYKTSKALINGKEYPLDDVRQFLLKRQEQLCANHFIKCIKIKGKQVFTYDWFYIFKIAQEAGYLNDFAA